MTTTRKIGHRLVIGADVMAVLASATAEGDRITLGPGQLDRKLYQDTDKALTMAGGKWNRGARAHVFPEPAEPILDRLLTTGEITDEKGERQAFYTPAGLAAEVAIMAAIETGDRVLEPSAGRGALAFAAARRGGDIFCVENDPAAVDHLRAEGYTVHDGDFMSTTAQTWPEDFDRVVMNPPFQNQQDVRHVLHAFDFLKPGGRLVSIMSASAPHRTNKIGTAFREWAEQNGAEFRPLPEGSFAESGTSVNTVLLVVTKPGG